MKLSCIRRLQKYTSTKFVTVPSNFVFIYHACSKLSETFRYKSNFFDAFHSFHAASRACKYYTLQSIEKIHSQMQTQRKSISIRRRSRRLSFYLLGYMVQIPQLELKKKKGRNVQHQDGGHILFLLQTQDAQTRKSSVTQRPQRTLTKPHRKCNKTATPIGSDSSDIQSDCLLVRWADKMALGPR